jgi:hypothetical protein
MQHGSIDDPASYRLHQLGMWNAVKGTHDTLPITSTFPKRSPLSDLGIRSKGNRSTFSGRCTGKVGSFSY